jgi:membrane fusion protein (multidrug efflux system)
MPETRSDGAPPPVRWIEPSRPYEWQVQPAPGREPPPQLDRPPPEDPRQAARKKRRRQILFGILGALLLAGAIGFGWYWYTTLRWWVSTDDAYTAANSVTISPQVSGYVAQLPVVDNEQVAKGQLLLRIDPRPYKSAVNQAQADVVSAQASIANIEAQISAQQSVIAQAQADIAGAKANLTFSEQEYARSYKLAAAGYGSVRAAEQSAADYLAKQATLQHDNGVLAAAKKQLIVLASQRAMAEAGLKAKEAALAQTRLNLGYTDLRSPITGAVGNKTVQIGQYLQPGQALMTIVPMGNRIYIVANFKETDIARMFRGEKAQITADAFPGVTLHGVIDSLAPGSGAVFALLPPENATGNFTKIVQRVPVKILLNDAHARILAQLRPGLSMTASVDTRQLPKNGETTLVPSGRR